MRIRDPIHGTIPVTEEETVVIDHRLFQRLRHIRQLGFGDLAFPGATHTRHGHSLGAMHVGARLFDAVAARGDLPPPEAARFRAAVRLAVLLHDVGHMPFSHASEKIAPAKNTLGLPDWLGGKDPGQASHEDFTAKLIVDSSLTQVIEKGYTQLGISPADIAYLVTGSQPPSPLHFTAGGVDWSPLLRALVSGELDADRMDYLLRDSFYTGVQYGRYDFEWIASNLNPAFKNGRAYLALSRAAAFAFEDFLLSRYHMFISVYLHHTAVSFDWMLQRFYEEARGEFEIPADPEAFLYCDDVALLTALRQSKNRWAERIVHRQGYSLLASFTERDVGYDLERLSAALGEAKVEFYSVTSNTELSKYAHSGPSLYILDVSQNHLTEVQRYTPLYERYSGTLRLFRLYVLPDHLERARAVLANLRPDGHE